MSGQPSRTIVETGGRVAESIVGGLTGTPGFLLIILLNIAFVLAAAYYLAGQEERRAATASQITDLLRICITRQATP
jgi:hypothetical protein